MRDLNSLLPFTNPILFQRKHLQEKIELLRQENRRLRAHIDADQAAADSEPTSSTTDNRVQIVPLGDEMSKCFSSA